MEDNNNFNQVNSNSHNEVNTPNNNSGNIANMQNMTSRNNTAQLNYNNQMNNNFNQSEYRPILRTDRNFWKIILLSLITFNIYGLVQIANIADETNKVCSKYDHKNTINGYLTYLLLGPITLGIFVLIWTNNLYSRMGNELIRRQIDYDFGAKTFWLYQVLFVFILIILSFIVPIFSFTVPIPALIGFNKFLEANRALNQSYNSIG
ncbi:DUF4234 domain-containing protein [Peptoanaerobacter stomatis]|uniref:DUF4234 domain-containing protein n=1 Tax=Peptoanaerobacter stomatis TaxID=796937 RepID=UPI003FA06DE1